jgi:DNA repair exonuclease SbcCD nuclease subunit
MRALWFTDLHLRPLHEEAGTRLLNVILKTAREQKPDIAICTGDVFHTKNILYGTMLDMFRDFLLELGTICPVYVIPGNHDYCIEYDVHALQGFKLLPNITVVDRSMKITDKVGIMSYSRQEARFTELFQELGPVEFLFGHFDMDGFDLGSGWEEKESWCDPTKFKGVRKVFSGHYHKRQRKVVNGVEILFAGTGATTEFGESDQEKFLTMVDLETGEDTEIPTGLTFHKTFRIEAGDAFPEIPEEELKNGVEFRLIIKGTQQQIALIDRPKDYPARVGYDFVTEVSDRLDVSSSDKKEDVLKKYLEFEVKKQGKAIEAAAFDMDRLMSIGARYVGKAGRK